MTPTKRTRVGGLALTGHMWGGWGLVLTRPARGGRGVGAGDLALTRRRGGGGGGIGANEARSGGLGVGGWHCTHKAVQTQGGARTRRLVATTQVLSFKWGARAGQWVGRSQPKCTMCVGRVGSGHTRRCIHKAMHTQGGLRPRQESCYLTRVRGLPPHRGKRAGVCNVCGKGCWCTHQAPHTQGDA